MEFFSPLYEKLESMWAGLVKLLPLIAIAAFTLLLTWLLARLFCSAFKATLEKSKLRKSLKELFITLLKSTVWTLGVLIAITIIFPSLTPAKLLTALGLGSVAVGLAFKDIFENFFAGILIMLRKPMRIGDYVQCEGIEGKVESISVRETYLRQTDDQLILVPNSFLFKNPVSILTDKALRRFEIIVGVAYGENVDQARSVIEQAFHEIAIIEKSKPIEVYAREFNSSSLDFTVRWWAASTPLDMHITRDQVVTSVKAALDNKNIEIPFPYRTLTFKEPLSIANKTSE